MADKNPRIPCFHRALVVIAAALALSLPAFAQTLTVQNPGTVSVALDGQWQFRVGDDLAWANPALDDSAWEHLSADNTAELPVDGSLPLGLAPDTKYDEISIHLREEDTLTFYTDGVIEAQNESGELYGFERTAALAASNPTVEQIVDVACAFGQKDDITVLRLVRLPQTAPAHTATIRIAAQIAGA